MNEEEERDLQRLRAAIAASKRPDASSQEKLDALTDAIAICYKYDAIGVEFEAKKHTLESLKVLEDLAANAKDPEVRVQAQKNLDYYNKIIFPKGAGPN